MSVVLGFRAGFSGSLGEVGRATRSRRDQAASLLQGRTLGAHREPRTAFPCVGSGYARMAGIDEAGPSRRQDGNVDVEGERFLVCPRVRGMTSARLLLRLASLLP